MWLKCLVIFALVASFLAFKGNCEQLGVDEADAVGEEENYRRSGAALKLPGVCGLHSYKRCKNRQKGRNGRQVIYLFIFIFFFWEGGGGGGGGGLV